MTTTAHSGSRTPAKVSGFIALLKETAADWMEDNAMRLAAALALYTILSMAPLVVITFKVVSVFLRDKADAQVQEQLNSLMGKQTADYVLQTFHSPNQSHQGFVAVIISTAILLFSATGVFAELQDSMNTIWGVKPKPNQGILGFVRNRLLSLGMVFGIGFLLLVSMFVSTLLTGVAQYLVGHSTGLAIAVDAGASLLVVTLLFAAIFKFLPDVRLSWRHVWTGAVLTAVLFTAGKYGLALYFKYAAPQSAYGAAGSLAAVLIWIYYSSFILFFGAEFTKVWSLHHGHRVIPDASAVKVTEEDRAQWGIPSEHRMEKAISGKPLAEPPASAKRPLLTTSHRGPQALRPVDAVIAAGGLIVGAVAAISARRLFRAGHLPQSGAERLRNLERGVVETFSDRRVLKDLAEVRAARIEKELAKR